MSFEPIGAGGLRRELEQAQIGLNHHLERRKHHDDEVARWQMVVDQLKQTISVLESPATTVRKIPIDGREPGKKRVRWSEAWPLVLGDLAARNIFPTKRALMIEIRARFTLTEGSAQTAVYSAVKSGAIVIKMDKCYLAGSEPRMPQVVSA